jgi:hypothetical protein
MFEQVELVKQNINNIRSFKYLKDSFILVASTSPKQGFLENFSDIYDNYNQISFVQMTWMDGNNDPRMYASNPNQRVSWRQEFLPKRILISMDKCLDLLYTIKSDVVLHLHSDSFWKPTAELQLLKETDWLMNNNGLFVGDLSDEGEDYATKTKTLRQGLHYQPEALLINLRERERLGYKFSKVYDPEGGFQPHNHTCIEAIFGELACFCLNGTNILSYNDIPPPEYYAKVKPRCQRGYHGDWNHLINLPGMQ